MEEALPIAVHLVILLYSCILHECGHVLVAFKLGDDTGVRAGRLTLNPIPHIDLFWTIILPVMTALTTGYPIGGPKPAPVNLENFRNRRTGFMWTALAGPATNVLLAALSFGLLYGLHAVNPKWVHLDSFMALVLVSGIIINISLAVYNMIPIPPLDGSRVLRFLLGPAGEKVLDRIEMLGFIPIFIAFYYLGKHAMKPFVALVHYLLALVYGTG